MSLLRAPLGCGLAALTVLAAAGCAPTRTADRVAATGWTTTVNVTMSGMRYHPDEVTVPAGNRLVVRLENTDSTVHDLRLDTGRQTGEVPPGESATLDAGVVGADHDGWCTIPGHKAQGMVFTVHVSGQSSSGTDGS